MVDNLILFRADGNPEMGLGHIVRSSALSEMIKDQYKCVLVTHCPVEELLSQISSNFLEVINLKKGGSEEEFNIIKEYKPNLVILDGYAFDSNYQQKIINQGIDFFSIDDIHAWPFQAQVIINHSGGLSPLSYQAKAETQFYLGPSYALLRKPFLEAAQKNKTIRNNNCFVCFGGADPRNTTLKVLKDPAILGNSRFKNFHVVVGSGYAYFKKLSEFVKLYPQIKIYQSLDPHNMVDVMKQCSYAICSPSTIVYEYMSIGGAVFLEQIADNQKDVIRFMTDEGLAFKLEDHVKVSEKEIQDSLNKQSLYFDGRSGERLKKIFSQFFESKKLLIRKARPNDLLISYKWANDPEVRSQSYNQELIQLDDHTLWFNNKMTDPSSYYYIFELDQKPVAQIRFQVNGNEAVLGYLLDSSLRSKGLGTSILGKGIERFINDHNKPVNIIGYVKEINIPSQRSFDKLAFIKERSSEYPASYKYIMRYGN